MTGFFSAGWEGKHLLEIILAIAIKTMSNYTNAEAEVPLDPEVAEG
ncbi:MAG: hypothetical protein AAF514_14730 [Verrucomicrobiota bacterium]